MPDDQTVNCEFYLGGPNQDVERRRLTIPGDKSSQWDNKVTDEDRLRWPDSYARFKEGVVDKAAGGTPLKEWPAMTIDRINYLNSLHIYTCEQLAGVQDGLISKLGMGAREENNKVKAWLEERRTQPSYDELKRQLAAMEERLAAMEEKRGPGRPRKEAA